MRVSKKKYHALLEKYEAREFDVRRLSNQLNQVVMHNTLIDKELDEQKERLAMLNEIEQLDEVDLTLLTSVSDEFIVYLQNAIRSLKNSVLRKRTKMRSLTEIAYGDGASDMCDQILMKFESMKQKKVDPQVQELLRKHQEVNQA